jgi:amidase
MRLDEYAALDATALAALVRRGEVSAREVTESVSAAIDAVNPALNAVVERYSDVFDQPDMEGPFRGVPYLIKDVGLHFAGRLMESGSRLCRGLRAAADDHFAALVRTSGVRLMGRTNTPEFSMALCAENLLHGRTGNPWNTGCSTSGSSGGAAAAVASGMVPLAHASDMGGSTRGPAAWCGVVGLQPSRGRVSAGPDQAEAGNGMAQSFAVTRTMRDTAAMLDVLAVPAPGDPFIIPRPQHPYTHYLGRSRRRFRIGWSAAPLMPAPVDRHVAAAVEAAARTLQDAGCDVEQAQPVIDLAAIDEACKIIWYYRFDRFLDDCARRTGRRVGPDTVEAATLRFYAFAKRLTDDDFFAAMAQFNRIRRESADFFTRYDAWLSPTCAQVARPHGVYGMNIALPPEEFLIHEQRPCQFMILANVTGQPALSLPLALHPDGLPIGVQLTARPAAEHVLIELGALLEQAMPWSGRRPPVHAAGTA